MSEAAEAVGRLQDFTATEQGRSVRGSGATRQYRAPKHTKELLWHWLPVVTMLSFIALESTDAMSGKHTGRILWLVFLWLGHPLTWHELDTLNHVLRKCGHVIGYGLLCASWLLLLRGIYWLRHEYQLCVKQGGVQIRRLWWRPVWGALGLLATCAVASADEFHQMSIPSRTGRWQDIVLDTTAALVALLLFRAKALHHCATSALQTFKN